MTNRSRCVALLACMVLVAGCGGDDDEGSSGSAATASGTTSGASSASGKEIPKKTIGVVNLVRQAPIEDNTDKVIEQAGEAFGWEIKIIDGAGDPQKWLAGAQSLINQNVDALITTSTEAATLRPALLAAQNKDIPVLGINGGTTPSDLFTAQYEEDEDKMGRQLAEFIAEEHPDGVKLINLQTTAATSGSIRNDAFHDVLPVEAFVVEQQIDQADPVANTQRVLTNALTAEPDANAVHATYDTEVAPASEVIKSKGKIDDVKVYSYFNVATTRELLMDPDSPLAAVSDNNLSHTGAVAMDQLLLHFAEGAEIDPDALEKNPLTYQVVTKENAADTPPATADEVLAPFLERWSETYALNGN